MKQIEIASLDGLEDLNFRNLVFFYSPELRRVLNGENVMSFFTSPQRWKLRKYGLLEFEGWGAGPRLVVTEKAKALISA